MLRKMAFGSYFLLLIVAILATISATIALPPFFPTPTGPGTTINGRNFYHQTLTQKRAPTLLNYKTKYFPQVLDHFSFLPKSSEVFYQKYLVNSQYWDKGGPIFVYTGNEGDIEWFASNTGFLLDIAPKFKALLVFIEHRFYGESMPFGKEPNKSAETLGYLTSQQALADYAVLIRSLKQNLTSDSSPVVVFGGSYGGMLAAWFRLKYPHIAMAALASSAPILQFDDITPWSSFYDAVSQDYKEASLNCYEVIKGSWDELEAMSSKKGGLVELSKTFRACSDINSIGPAWNWLWSAFVYTAMVNYPTSANFMKPLPAYPVQQMCKIIDALPHGTSKLSKAFAAASLYYNYTGNQRCFQFEHRVDAHGLDGWNWQACTEMVMPMICSKESMFPPSTFDYKEFSEGCKRTYGVTPRPHWITTEFGGQRIEQVLKRSGGNIIFSNGMQDPWSRGSVLKNISSSIFALVTEKGAHHLDFRSATKEDPDWLVEQRRQEVEIIKHWIYQYYTDLKNNVKEE